MLINTYGPGIEKQYLEFSDMCSFLREVLTILYNEQKSTCPWDEAGMGELDEDLRRGFRNLQNVKEAFLVAFFDLILCCYVQDCFIESDPYSPLKEKSVTIMRYLIEIMCLANDKTLAKLIYSFLFNKASEVLFHFYHSEAGGLDQPLNETMKSETRHFRNTTL